MKFWHNIALQWLRAKMLAPGWYEINDNMKRVYWAGDEWYSQAGLWFPPKLVKKIWWPDRLYWQELA